MVEVLDGAEFEGYGAVVAGFVGCLDMEVYEIVAAAKSVDGCLRLALVVSVVETCGAGDVDDVEACIAAYATDEVDGGDDGTAVHLLREAVGQRKHLRAIASARLIRPCRASTASL